MLTKLFVIAGSLVASVALAGCASSGSKPSSPTALAEGMICPTCETVWVTQVVDQGTKTQRLSSTRQMSCPHCDATAEAYLKEGKKVLHDCPDCKATLVPVKPAQAASPRGPRSF